MTLPPNGTKRQDIQNIHRQRLNGLKRLVMSILGPDTYLPKLVQHLNSHLGKALWAQTKILGPLQGDMQILCPFAGWPIPIEF